MALVILHFVLVHCFVSAHEFGTYIPITEAIQVRVRKYVRLEKEFISQAYNVRVNVGDY